MSLRFTGELCRFGKPYFHVAVLVSIILMQTGCASMGKEAAVHMPADIPKAWTSELPMEQLPIASGLLELIDDDRLKELVREALENNPNLCATAMRLESAGYLLSGPRSRRLPEVNASFAKGRNNQNIDTETGDRYTEDSHRLSMGVSWEIDIWGRLADNYAAAERAVRAQEYDYLHARDALAARVIQAWVEQVAIQRALVIEKERVAVLKNIETVLLERYRDGIGNLEELSTAKSRTEIARSDLIGEQTNRSRSVRKLEVLIGRHPRGELLSGGDLPEITSPPVSVPAEILLKRPDLRAALAMVESARYASRSAKKAMLPNVTLSSQVFKDSARMGSIGGGDTYWNVLGSIFQPLFEGGRLVNESRARQSEFEAALLDLHGVVLQALLEVENELDRDRELSMQAEALEISVRESKKSSRYYQERYRHGLDTIQSLLIAKEQETAVRLRLNRVLAERLSNRVDLALALGVAVEVQASDS